MARIALTRFGETCDERHLDPLLLEDRERELVVAVENGRRLVHLADAAQRIDVGQAVSQRIRNQALATSTSSIEAAVPMKTPRTSCG